MSGLLLLLLLLLEIPKKVTELMPHFPLATFHYLPACLSSF